MKESIRVRRFRAGDEAALFEIFHSAVHRIAVADYTPRQIEAWAPRTLDALAWRDAMRTLAPFVVLRGEQPVGYADLQGNGYIDHFFVSGHHPRQGIGGLLMARLEAEAERRHLQAMCADVSRTAEPFFARYGFEVVERRSRRLRGEELANAYMRKLLRSKTAV